MLFSGFEQPDFLQSRRFYNSLWWGPQPSLHPHANLYICFILMVLYPFIFYDLDRSWNAFDILLVCGVNVNVELLFYLVHTFRSLDALWEPPCLCAAYSLFQEPLCLGQSCLLVMNFGSLCSQPLLFLSHLINCQPSFHHRNSSTMLVHRIYKRYSPWPNDLGFSRDILKCTMQFACPSASHENIEHSFHS